MAGGGEEARFGDISLVSDLLGGVERFRGPLLFGDVREGYYDTLDQAVVGPVRQYKSIVPYPVLGRNFTFNDLLFVKNNRGVADEIAIVRERCEIGQRSTNIRGNHPEQRNGRRCEKPDFELFIRKDRGDARAFQNILKIVGRVSLPFKSLVELSV